MSYRSSTRRARTICELGPGAAIDHELGASRDSAIALHDTCGAAKLRIVARTKIALIAAILLRRLRFLRRL